MGCCFGSQGPMDAPQDTVLLFQFSRGLYAPSLSPFPVKLETYLRMAKIPYQNNLNMVFSKKHKIPWIRYNGQDISDSQLCIDFLNKKRGIDLNKHLSTEQRAVAYAFQRAIDDAMYWLLVYYRWVTDEGMEVNNKALGSCIGCIVRPGVKKQANAQGISRNSPEEVKHMAIKDLMAIENYLGDKQFLMGNEPSQVDCSLFGFAAQLMWQMTDPSAKRFIPDNCPKLAQYCERMKSLYWPDWDECHTHGGTKKATK